MANKYANQIYEAIDILTDQKLRNLNLDRTVQAIVKDNTNANKGYYTIEIQDANQNQQIIARSNRIDYVYPLNSCVYVTIPQNNSALDKWILGSVEVETSELDAYYLEEERPVKSGVNGVFDGALALAQLIGGGDMLIIDFKVKDSEASGDGDGKLSFKGVLKVGNTELVPVELNEDNIEGDPYFVDDTQRFTYKIPVREYEITDIISFQVDNINTVDIEIDKIYIGKSDNKPFTKLLTAKLLNTADPPQSQEKIVFNFAADAIQRLQLQAYYNGVAIENKVTYSWAFDDATMNHVISGSATGKNAIFSRNELWRDGTFNFTAAITYDGERVPITSSVSSINFPVVSISQSTAGETTTLTANLMVGSDIKENPWGGRTELTYLWNDRSTNKFITRPKLKSGDSQNYTCIVKQQGIEIGSGNSVVIPQPEAAAQGVIAITNGNALLVWDESNTFKNDEIVLSATIYDINGKEVCSTADDGTEKPVTGDNGWLDSITWIVHANELYKVKDNTGTNQPTLTIVAKGDFNLDVEVPQIEVTLTIKEDKFHQYYPDRELKDYTNLYAITEFTATQQGMPGTNGSKYIVKPLVDYVETYNPEVYAEDIIINFRVNNIEYQSDIQLYRGDIEYQVISNYSELSHIDEIIIDSTFEADQGDETTQAIFDNTKEFGVWYKLHDSVVASYEFSLLDIISLTVKDNNDQSFTVSPTKNQAINSYGSYIPITPATWNDSYSIQEYGFLAAAAPYIRVKPRVWDVELKQWLPEEGLSYSTQLMYARNPEGISKVANTNEYHLTVTSVDYNTTNIIRLTVTLDGKKFTTYLPLVIGTEGTTLNIFQDCLNHPFFYVMYDSTSTVPFYRYKQNAQSLWVKSNCGYEIALNNDPAPKYLVASSGVLGVKVNDQKIFTNDGENENFALTSLTSAFYVPILFANVTSLYDFVGEWDGESAQIGEDYVISPIAAFGNKDDNNRFTGLVLGAVNDSHTSYEEEFKGMIGYYQNQRTFELNATNGMAKFGRSGKGQIVIDPSQNEALIYGGNYNIDLKSAIKIKATYDSSISYILSLDEDSINFKTKDIGGGQIEFTLFEDSTPQRLDISDDQIYDQNWDEEFIDNMSSLAPGESVIVTIVDISNVVSAEGMLINLTKPSIEWGNENFSVDKDGKLNAKNGIFEGNITATSGSIANFQINGSNLIGYNNGIPTVGLCSTNDSKGYAFWAGGYASGQVPGTNAPFRVSHDGTLHATGGDFTDGTISGGTIIGSVIQTSQYSEGVAGVQISNSGGIEAKKGKIGGFVIGDNILKSADDNLILNSQDQTISFKTTKLTNLQRSAEITSTFATTLSTGTFTLTYYRATQGWGVSWNNVYAFKNYNGNYFADKQNQYKCDITIFADYLGSYHKILDIDIPINTLPASGASVNITNYCSAGSANLSRNLAGAQIKIYTTCYTIYSNGEPVTNERFYMTTTFKMPNVGDDKTYIFNGYDTGTYVHSELYSDVYVSGTELACTGHFIPGSDNNYTLGNSARRWSQVWAATGTIQTSDRNAKNSIEAIPSQYLDFYNKLNPVRYKFNQNTSNRYHVGLIAQDVEKALQESNISTQDFAGFISYAQEDGTGYGLRYDEFIALCIAKTQQQDKEISDLKSEIQELKTLISQLRGQEG